MSVNCVVIRNGIPVPINKEQFLHLDEGVSLNVEPASGGFSAMNSYRGKGKIYTTNYRLIFLKENPSAIFSSFCIPYLTICDNSSNNNNNNNNNTNNNNNKKDKNGLRLKKQLFGGCTISGKVYPTRNGGLQRGTLSKFEIKFDDTGTGKQFFTTLEKQYKYALQHGKSHNNNLNYNDSNNSAANFYDTYNRNDNNSNNKNNNRNGNNNNNNNNNDMNEYEQVCHTPSLPVEMIFPDQFQQSSQNGNNNSNIQHNKSRSVNKLPQLNMSNDNNNSELKNDDNSNSNNNNNNNNDNKLRAKSVIERSYTGPSSYFSNDQTKIIRPSNFVVASQTRNGAPLKLTSDFRTHEAKLFGDNVQASQGPVIGASPAIMNRRNKGTKIMDETARSRNGRSNSTYNSSNNNSAYGRPLARMMSSPLSGPSNPSSNYGVDPNTMDNKQEYEAFVDPSNPDDIVLAMPNQDSNHNNNNNRNSKNNHNNNNNNDNNGSYMMSSANGQSSFFTNQNNNRNNGAFGEGINLDDLPDFETNGTMNKKVGSTPVVADLSDNLEDSEDSSNESNDLPPKISSHVKAKPQTVMTKQVSKSKSKSKNKLSLKRDSGSMGINKLKSVSDMDDNEHDIEIPRYSPHNVNSDGHNNVNNNGNDSNNGQIASIDASNPFEMLLQNNVHIMYEDEQQPGGAGHNENDNVKYKDKDKKNDKDDNKTQEANDKEQNPFDDALFA